MNQKENTESFAGRVEKKNPFTVPGNYFDSFPEKLSKRIHAGKPEKISTVERVWQVLRPQIALAAAITGFALIGYFGLRTFVETGQEWLSDEEITGYMEYYQDDFADYYLLSLLEENDFYFEEDTDIESWYYEDDPDLYIEYLYQDEIPIDLLYTDF